MGIIWQGKTKCKICSEFLSESDEIVLYPDIIYDENNLVSFFSGESFHLNCFNKHKIANKAVEILEKHDEDYEKKVCIISTDKITLDTIKHPDNHVYLLYFTDDKENDLFQFNFKHINKRYFEFWDKKNLLIKSLYSQKKKSGWSKLNSLIKNLESPLAPPISQEIIERVNKYRNKR